MTNYLNQGSEWRKWDLHVHSPKTFLNNQFNGCGIDDFVNKIYNSGIKVVGLTNYFRFDDAEFDIKNKLELKGVTVFLNLEIRLAYQNKNNDCCDLHIIFNNLVTADDINDFVTKLNVDLDGSQKMARDLTTTDEFNKATIEFDHLIETLQQESLGLTDKYLIGFLSRGAGNARTSTNYEKIAKNSNFLIHSSDSQNNIEEDREYWLEQNKPLLQSSDAHNLENIGNKFTWIKANPTFEGLKQILYEPADRVKIQAVKPEEKESYQIIQKVKFIDDSFMTDDIPINQNLTVIIGGKSTGKSILLRNIAQAIDSNEVRQRLGEVNLTELRKVKEFEVAWADGQKSGADNINKKIIYIPQSYLNRLADKEEEKGGMHNIIEDVLKQEQENVYDDLANFERKNNEKIATNIALLFSSIDSCTEQREKINNMGDKKGIEIEINNLEKEITQLKKASGMSEDEIKKYSNFVSQIKELQKLINENELNKNKLVELKQDLSFYDIDLSELSEDIAQSVNKFYTGLKTNTQKKWEKFLTNEVNSIETPLIENERELKKINAGFKPLLNKAKKSELLREKIKQIEKQQNKLAIVKQQEEQLNKILDSIEETKKCLVGLNAKFFNKYNEAKEQIIQQTNISGDIYFNLEVKPKTKSFQEDFINKFFDQRKLPKELSNYKFKSKSDFSKKVADIISDVFNDEISIKGGYNKNNVVTKLLENWYMYDYQITQNGDNISIMSPGKKSFVLLKLLIELDNSKCPILLDQPEDDLDSRSIYNDLVKFIKIKKQKRQFIIATHNPNLAVGADAECVIVANQKGDNSKNKKYKFEYVSGALENTFSKDNINEVLYQQGIREHVCDILEGGNIAFEKREKQYGFK